MSQTCSLNRGSIEIIKNVGGKCFFFLAFGTKSRRMLKVFRRFGKNGSCYLPCECEGFTLKMATTLPKRRNTFSTRRTVL